MSPPLILPLPLESIIQDVRKSIEQKLYYPALLVALTIPEICSALALSRNTFVKDSHYASFVDNYTSPAELGLGGVDCYRLRGGVVHRASFAGHPKFGATHVIFTIPESNIRNHAFSIVSGDSTAVMLDLVKFCDVMVSAARKWFADNKNNALVIENMDHMIRYCPFGMPPFFAGSPVVGSGRS